MSEGRQGAQRRAANASEASGAKAPEGRTDAGEARRRLRAAARKRAWAKRARKGCAKQRERRSKAKKSVTARAVDGKLLPEVIKNDVKGMG